MTLLGNVLPPRWALATLGDIGEYHNGRGFKAAEWADAGRPIIRIQNLTDPTKPFNHYAGDDVDPRNEIHTGDLLMSWAATLDVFRWMGPAAVLNQHIFKVESYIDPSYHYYVLKHALDALYAQSHGSGMVHITRGRFDATPVLVPPLAEQRRIVRLLDAMLAEVRNGAELLSRALSAVDDFRTACLAAAFDGPLCPLGNVATIQSGITKGRARPDAVTEVPYIRTANVQALRLDLGEIKTLWVTPTQHERYQLQRDDVLVLEGGDADKVGRGWIWGGEVSDCIHQNHVFAVRPDRGRLLPRYLAYYINAPQARRYFLTVAKQTTNLASINKTNLMALPVPVPDVESQDRTAGELDEQLLASEEIAFSLQERLGDSDVLQRALLQAAMTGRLSRPEAGDEPAENVLARATREQASRRRDGRRQNQSVRARAGSTR